MSARGRFAKHPDHVQENSLFKEKGIRLLENGIKDLASSMIGLRMSARGGREIS